MSTPDDVTRAEGLAEARTRAAKDRQELIRNLPAAISRAKSRAKPGPMGWALVRGAPRAIRHTEGVAELLWDFAEAVQREAEAELPNRSRQDANAKNETHFRTDGNPSREANRKGSYRVSVRAFTHAAVVADHEDHLLLGALAAVKGKDPS